ncbi:MAG: class A beta-lactamase-related serine hydrolase [Synergistaceae bacterium]|jgi:beta-lactamase class A|nr:class A beta-lactamase-related serine hydrolase [Synergistaceae bacterium]
MLTKILEYAQSFGDSLGMVVRDIPGGGAVTLNENRRFPSASIIKVPIMWEYFRKLSEGGFKSEDRYILKNDVKVGVSRYDCGILREMHEGMELTYFDILSLMIIISDDTATNILIDLLGMDNINATMRSLGLKNTFIRRVMMDYDKVRAGIDNETTAGDMDALLMLMVTENERMKPEYRQQMLTVLSKQQINTAIPLFLPETLKIAHKTGCIPEFDLEHDVGIVYSPQEEPLLAISLMSKNLRDSRTAFGTIAKMAYDLLR